MSASEELPHQTFERLVEEGGLGTLERLPKNCLATYAYRGNGCEEGMVVPLKFAVEAPSTVWQWNYGLYKGLVVLWMTSLKKILMYDNRRYDGKKPSNSEKIVRILCEMVRSRSDIGMLLSECDLGLYQNLANVLTKTKFAIATREEFLRLREPTFQLEADAHEELEALLGSALYLTPEKCKADCFFHLGDEHNCLPIQTKSATLNKQGTASNQFHKTNKYKSMLLFCRPMRRIYVGTIVMPGALAPSQFQIVLSDSSRYATFLVPDCLLLKFTIELYTAIKNETQSLVWPSGAELDISSIKLDDIETICMPSDSSSKVERENYLRRRNSLPNLTYILPRVQGTTVDVILNGVEVQDKSGHQVRNELYYTVNIVKNGGPQRRPYEDGDFQVLWVHLNRNRRYFFIIPANELIKHKIMKSKESEGRVTVMCYLPGYQKSRIGRPADPWTKKYCFDYEDVKLESKVITMLRSCTGLNDKTERY